MFWVAQEYIGSDILATRGHRFVKDADFREVVLGQLDNALATLRGAGIVHRNVGADVISVDTDNRILLSGLEFSSAAEGHTARRTVAHRHRQPPEVAAGHRDSYAGDIYAAGLMVLDLLVPGEGSPSKRVRKLKDHTIARELAACIGDDPHERPKSLESLRKALKEGCL